MKTFKSSVGMSITHFVAVLFTVALMGTTLIGAGAIVRADDLKTQPASAKSNSDAKPAPASRKTTAERNAEVQDTNSVTASREAAALAFVKKHHPELAELIVGLRDVDAREYRRAIIDLFHTSERLSRSRERNQERYRLELRSWKLDSRLRLVVARLSMDRSPELEAELRQAIVEQQQVKLELLQFEAARARQRLERVEEQIRKQERNRSQIIDQQVERLLNPPARKKSSSKK